jgi:Mlc titration factor MtfA (ptsG expression regulator)
MDAFFTPNTLRRAQIAARPFPAEWEPFLRANCFIYPLLTDAEQIKLRSAVQILIAEKYWEGCGGLKTDPEIQVTISAWASLLLLGWDDYYFDRLKTILVYPGPYISHIPYIGRSPQTPDQTAMICSGQAHAKGPVVLSWWDARWEGQHAGNRNVVVHEFAHKLAELGDSTNGIPLIEDDELRERWKQLAAAEYARLREDVAYDRPTVLDSYGATNPAEFFAVATECFFLNPDQLRQRHRRLYRCFVRFFRQDPARRPTAAQPGAVERQRIERGYLERSLAGCTAAIQRFPDAPRYYRARASVYRRLGDFEHAVADFSSAIDRSDDDARAEMICERGRVYAANGRHTEAVADFDQAIRLCPRYGRAFCERGIAHASAARTEEALRDLSRAIRLDRQDDKAYHRRGQIYCDRGEYARAVRDLTRAIRIDRHRATYYCARARARLGMDDHHGAIADCERALRRDPELAKAYVLRAVAFDNLGDRARASADAAAAARLEGRNG